MNQSWSIIIFVYNEENSIISVIRSALSVLHKIAPENHELIIVNDGSTDKTLSLINEILPNLENVKLINHNKNLGIGKALLSGYYNALYENICAIPADGQFNPEELLPFKDISENTIVSFFRTRKIQYSLFRKMLSLGNKILNQFFLKIKIKDVNWVKVYKKNIFNSIYPILTSSLVESEICAKVLRCNYKIIEVPSVCFPRNSGKSKGASLKTIFMAVHEIFRLYFILKRSSKPCH